MHRRAWNQCCSCLLVSKCISIKQRHWTWPAWGGKNLYSIFFYRITLHSPHFLSFLMALAFHLLYHPNTLSPCLWLFLYLSLIWLLSIKNSSPVQEAHSFLVSFPLTLCAAEHLQAKLALRNGSNKSVRHALPSLSLGKPAKMPHEMSRCLPAVDREHKIWRVQLRAAVVSGCLTALCSPCDLIFVSCAATQIV